MAHYGGGGGGYGGYNAEKVSQIVSWFIFVIGLMETFFVTKNGKSFLAANIPYLQFDITSPAYGFVIAITMAVTLAVALGLALRTLAIIGIMFWLAVSGIVSCSDKGVRFENLGNATLTAGEKKAGSVGQTLAEARGYISKRVGKDEPKETDKAVIADNLFANIDAKWPEFAAAVKKNNVSEFLSSTGYVVKTALTAKQLEWCETTEGLNYMTKGDVKAWIQCTTGKKWVAPIADPHK